MKLPRENLGQNSRMRFLRVWWLLVCAVPAWAAHGYALWDDLKAEGLLHNAAPAPATPALK